MISPEILRRYPYFTAGGEEVIEELAVHSKEVTFSPKEYIFREGDPADTIYIITKGEVDIILELGDGTEREVDSVVAGDLLGWSAFLRSPTYRASALVVRPTSAIAIDGKRLIGLCAENHEFGYRIMCELIRALAHRLENTWVQLASCGD